MNGINNSLVSRVGNGDRDLSEAQSSAAELISQFLETWENVLDVDDTIPSNSATTDSLVDNSTIITDSTTPIDLGGTTFEVKNIGVFNSNNSMSFNDSIEAESHPDVYQFRLDRPNDFAATLDGLSADVDLSLIDDSGAEVAISDNSALAAESLSETLDAGTYSLAIIPNDDIDAEYRLSIQTGEFAAISETTPAVAGDSITSEDPGGDIDSAFDLGAFNGTGMLTYSEEVGGSDFRDVYEFSIDQSNDFNFVLEGMSADVDLHLVDIEGEILAASENYNTEAEILTGNLSAGTYFLGVDSHDGIDTNYNLHAIGGENALSLAEINEVVAPGLATEFTLV